jgi:hypothetical protein
MSRASDSRLVGSSVAGMAWGWQRSRVRASAVAMHSHFVCFAATMMEHITLPIIICVLQYAMNQNEPSLEMSLQRKGLPRAIHSEVKDVIAIGIGMLSAKRSWIQDEGKGSKNHKLRTYLYLFHPWFGPQRCKHTETKPDKLKKNN